MSRRAWRNVGCWRWPLSYYLWRLLGIAVGIAPLLYLIAPERSRQGSGDDGAYSDCAPSGIGVFDEFPDDERRNQTGKVEPVARAA